VELTELAILAAIVVALLTAGAGIWMMRYGYKLTEQQINLSGLRPIIHESVKAVNDTVVQAGSVLPEDQDVVGQLHSEMHVQEVQATTQAFGSAAEYVKGLAELAKSLTSLTPAVSAFVVSTILFFFAGSIATAVLFLVFQGG
jgi:hypothetical protein